GTGLVSALAQVLMTEAYRRGEPSLVAPFEYSGIVWTTVLGGILWGELPDGWDFAGIAVLVGAGLYIWHREVSLGLRR
ncbi:MAG: DMT family transporter, partial [Pseudomonadota bacterium]